MNQSRQTPNPLTAEQIDAEINRLLAKLKTMMQSSTKSQVAVLATEKKLSRRLAQKFALAP